MCRKLCAFLLCLYPPGFRKTYGEEYLQLCADRWRSETGLFRKSRLIYDLIADSVIRTPHEWWIYNAQHSAAIAIPRTEGVPTFRMFESKPLYPGFVVFGAVLSFSALYILMFVVSHARVVPPSTDASAAQSPIESVMQRVNRPINHGSGIDYIDPQNASSANAHQQSSSVQQLTGGKRDTVSAQTDVLAKHGAATQASVVVCNGCKSDGPARQQSLPVLPGDSPQAVVQMRAQYQPVPTPVVVWPERQTDGSPVSANRSSIPTDCIMSAAPVSAKRSTDSKAAQGGCKGPDKANSTLSNCFIDTAHHAANPTPCVAPAPPARRPARTGTRLRSRTPR